MYSHIRTLIPPLFSHVEYFQSAQLYKNTNFHRKSKLKNYPMPTNVPDLYTIRVTQCYTFRWLALDPHRDFVTPFLYGKHFCVFKTATRYLQIALYGFEIPCTKNNLSLGHVPLWVVSKEQKYLKSWNCWGLLPQEPPPGLW